MATHRAHCAALAVACVIAVNACSFNGDPEGFGGEYVAKPPAEYRIGPEDELSISVWKDETLSRVVPVRPDGKISLPLLYDVQAAGLTPQELRDALKKKLAAFMPNPEVSVIVTAVGSAKVSVIGEVMRPGVYEIKGRSTVLDALALAEGLTPFASRARIVVMRHEGDGVKRISFNYNRAISVDGENFFLRPGDIVVVP